MSSSIRVSHAIILLYMAYGAVARNLEECESSLVISANGSILEWNGVPGLKRMKLILTMEYSGSIKDQFEILFVGPKIRFGEYHLIQTPKRTKTINLTIEATGMHTYHIFHHDQPDDGHDFKDFHDFNRLILENSGIAHNIVQRTDYTAETIISMNLEYGSRDFSPWKLYLTWRKDEYNLQCITLIIESKRIQVFGGPEDSGTRILDIDHKGNMRALSIEKVYSGSDARYEIYSNYNSSLGVFHHSAPFDGLRWDYGCNVGYLNIRDVCVWF